MVVESIWQPEEDLGHVGFSELSSILRMVVEMVN